jgi:hypothetical protein
MSHGLPPNGTSSKELFQAELAFSVLASQENGTVLLLLPFFRNCAVNRFTILPTAPGKFHCEVTSPAGSDHPQTTCPHLRTSPRSLVHNYAAAPVIHRPAEPPDGRAAHLAQHLHESGSSQRADEPASQRPLRHGFTRAPGLRVTQLPSPPLDSNSSPRTAMSKPQIPARPSTPSPSPRCCATSSPATTFRGPAPKSPMSSAYAL